MDSLLSNRHKTMARLYIDVLRLKDGADGEEKRPSNSRLGPACNKARKGNKPSQSENVSRTATDAEAAKGDISQAASTVSMVSVSTEENDSRKRPRKAQTLVLSFSDTEEEVVKRPRGRPALNPAHTGKFTAQAIARR